MTQPGQDRLAEIDWMRGIAALGVFAFHASGVAQFPKRTLPPFSFCGRTWGAVPSPLAFGATGVSLFFVVSGFCLALQRWRSVSSPAAEIDTAVYARDRFARIVPAYGLVVILCVPIVAWLQPTRPILAPTLTHLLFAHGFIPSHIFELNGALWSMATEVQFYVAFPFVLALYPRLGRYRFTAAVVGFVLVFRILVWRVPGLDGGDQITTRALLSNTLPGRLAEFAFGMVLADLVLFDAQRGARFFRWSVWLAMPAAVLARGCGPYDIVDPIVGVGYTALLGALLLAWRQTIARTAMSKPSSRGARFGRASYSFFLVHAPVLEIVDRLLPVARESPYARFAALVTGALPLSVLIASVLYLNVELPFWTMLRSKKKMEIRRAALESPPRHGAGGTSL